MRIGRNMKKLFVIILTVLMICSCESDSPQIGSDFFKDGVLDFSYIDSATVRLSTIQLEDMATNDASRLLLGTHQDKRLGKITASCYFQLTPSGTFNFKEEDFIYDYLSLVLYLDDYSYYDTLSPLTLNVHRVAEDIETDEGYLYNSSQFKIDDESLGSISFKPRPHGDSVEIRLSDFLGKEIFRKAKEGGDELTAANFLEFIPGLAVLPDTSHSACIIGLATNPTLKLHYIDRSTTPRQEEESTFDVNSSSSLYFTNITSDRKNTSLEIMPSSEGRVSSTITNDEAYIQAGGALAMRVDIPYLRSLKQLQNFYVTQAVLEIFTVRKSSVKGAVLPQQLLTFKADKRNSIYQEIATQAALIEDQDLDRRTYYRLDVTEFVKEQMELQTLNENALIFTTSSDTYPVAADRVYASAPSYEYKTRLRIYYATVND